MTVTNTVNGSMPPPYPGAKNKRLTAMELIDYLICNCKDLNMPVFTVSCDSDCNQGGAEVDCTTANIHICNYRNGGGYVEIGELY